MLHSGHLTYASAGRAPYGARGLKSACYADVRMGDPGRAPYGARGLKFYDVAIHHVAVHVAPRMGRVD